MVTLRFRRSRDAELRGKFSAIADPQAARSWLAGLTPPDSESNLELIGEFIGELMEGSAPIERKYEVCEVLRAALAQAMRDRVNDISFRSVPLSIAEADVVWALVDTAEDLREAYELFIPRLPDPPRVQVRIIDEPAVPGEAAKPGPNKVVALHRALDLNAQVLVVYLRMRVAVPDRLWDQHCRLGQLVRQLNCQDDAIEDPIDLSLTPTCREAFGLPLLLALADPSQLSHGEFLTALMAASRWARKVGFRIDTVAELGAPAQRPVGNPGPVFPLAGGAHQVRLDTQKVVKSAEGRIGLLGQGKQPRAIGLGEALSPVATRNLLQALTKRWGPGVLESIDFPEQTWRGSTSEFALAVVNIASRADPTKRLSATQPTAVTYDYVRIRDDGLTRSVGELERLRIDSLLEDAETWSIVGETPESVLCMRRHSRPRLSMGQLLGLKLGGKAGPIPFLLGYVLGLQQGVNDNEHGVARPAATHLVRVRLIPGIPQAVKAAVDGTELEGSYLLVPNLGSSGVETIWDELRAVGPKGYGLVLPLATFRPGRVVRVVAAGIATAVRLEDLVHRGQDFDHVTFALV